MTLRRRISGLLGALRRQAPPRREVRVDLGRRELLALCVTTVVVAAAVGVLILGREYLAFATETDFLGGFHAEARRFLGGRPLELVFHPPLYPIVVGSLSKLLGGWVAAGLFVSWVAGIAALLCSFWFFRIAAGPAAGWGAYLAAVTSSLYVAFWAQATSELFFLALYSGAFLLAVLAVTNDDRRLWVALGLAVGLGMLTRANGVVVALLAATPLALSGADRPDGDSDARYPRIRRIGLVAGGLALPLAAWAAFALATGSRLVPQGNYANLAMTYFGEGLQGAVEDRRTVEAQFTGLWDVLSHDPVRLLKTYLRDLRSRLMSPFQINHLVAFPVAHLAVLGLLILPFVSMKLKLLYLVVAGGHVLFLNFAPYQSRFYLFLVPFLGALAGFSLEALSRPLRDGGLRAYVAGAVAGAMLLVGGLPSMLGVPGTLKADEAELRTAVREVEDAVDEGDVIVTRKPHIPFYVETEGRYFPRVGSVSELGRVLSEWTTAGDVFVYYGSNERERRGELSRLDRPEEAPGWLSLVAQNRDPRWLLYRFEAEGVP